MGGVLLENDVFLILFSSGEIAKYTYDPNLAAVPEVQLRAYSLMENEQLRTVISSYQAGHPEVYIRYEIGMDKNLSATRDDALKKLNTEIAAGKIPFSKTRYKIPSSPGKIRRGLIPVV